MRFKRLLALLLAAALALAVLVGCGSGQQSAARVLLNLLDGKYPNISIEIDPDLEADLRQAISQAEAENAGDDAAAIRAALEKLVGSTVTFRNLGDGQQGDTTFDLVFYAGTDPDKAAQAAYSQWNIVFANVPDDGKYGTGLAMVETENGIWMLVKATVEKAGTEDKAEPAAVTRIEVTGPTKTQYNPGDPFNPAGMVVTVHYSNGSTKKIENITSSGNQGVTWSPAKIDADTTVTITYGGKNATVEVKLITLTEIKVTHSPTKTEYTVGDSFDPDGMEVTAYYSDSNHIELNPSDYTFTITAKGSNNPIDSSKPFNTAGEYTLTVEYNGITSNSITITVVDKGYTDDGNGNYTVTSADGLKNVAKLVNEEGKTDINITLDTDLTLTGEWTPIGTESQPYTGTFDGGGHTIMGLNISSPSEAVALFHTIGGGGKVMNLQLKDVTYNGSTAMGGIAHGNNGTITACSVTGTLTNTTNNGAVGGIAAINFGTITACWFNGTITGGSNVGGIAAFNLNAGSYSGKIAACYWSGGGISNGVGNGYDISGTTKVDNSTVTWRDAVDGMNKALTDNDYKWVVLGADDLPTLT